MSKLYGAYTEVSDVFSTFEEAVGHLDTHPGTEGRTVSAVTLIQSRGSQGIQGVPVSGEPEDPYQAFVVKVAHATPGGVFVIEYLIEYKEDDSGEEFGNLDDSDGAGNEENPETVDEGDQQPGENTEGHGEPVIDWGDEAE